MTNSTHKVEVVRIEEVLPHDNADLLEVVPIWGYQCCVAKGSFKVGDLAAYIPPDSVAKTSRPEFAFLATKPGQATARIKAKRLRGIWSMGLLLPVPDGSQVGDDVAELLEVAHYEPPAKLHGSRLGCHLDSGAAASPPSGNLNICYDVEAWRRYAKRVFQEGEPVAVTEKIHGANARYVWADGELHCGSRNQWKQEFPRLPTLGELIEGFEGDEIKAAEVYGNLLARPRTQDLWWRAIRQYPEAMAWLQAHPGCTLYGEVFGQVQDLTYGTQQGEVRLAFFDVLGVDGRWWNHDELRTLPLPLVPLIYRGPYEATFVEVLASGNSLIPGAEKQIREGIVIRPVQERCDPYIGRVVLKLVSNEYLSR